MASSGVLYFNASIVNNNVQVVDNEDILNVPLSFNRTFNANIVNRCDDYEVSVIRMVLPSDNIDIMNITKDNQNDYTVGLYSSSYESTCALPRNLSVSELSSGDIPYNFRSQLDVVEAVNRSLTHCYNMLMQNAAPIVVNYPSSASVNSSSYTLSSPKYLCAINIKIGGVTISGTSKLQIYFKAGDKKYLLWAGSTDDPEYKLFTDINNPIIFSDSALLPFNRCLDTKSVYKFQPYEPLLNTSNNMVSNYQVLIESDNPATFKFGINMASTETLPTIAPTFLIDTNGKLTLQLQQAYITNNIRCEMSPKLYRLFTFGAQSRRYYNGMYQMIYPQCLLTQNAPTQILSIEQFQSTRYRFNHITNILVIARNLDVNGEFYNDYIRDNCLIDFALDTTTDMENIIYSSDAGLLPLRRYRMNSSAPLTNLAFDIYAQYSDGSTKKLFIRSGCSFQLKLAFYPL
jgi:hypothetical protein